LKENDYSLQANKKNIEGSSVPERDAQFRYINEQAKEFINQGYPVISVDAKKKENIGMVNVGMHDIFLTIPFE